MPVGRVLPLAGGRQRLRSLTTVGDFEFTSSPALVPGTFVSFDDATAFTRTAVNVSPLSWDSEPVILAEALRATDPSARRQALQILAAKGSPETLAEACERLLVDDSSVGSTIAEVTLGLLEDRPEEWRDAFRRAVLALPNLSSTVIPSILKLGTVKTDEELVTSITAVERLKDSSLRSRFSRLLSKLARTHGLPTKPSRDLLDCPLPDVRERARKLWVAAFYASPGEVTTISAEGELAPDWLQLAILDSASIDFLSLNVAHVAKLLSSHRRLELLRRLADADHFEAVRILANTALGSESAHEVAAILPDAIAVEMPWCLHLSSARVGQVLSENSENVDLQAKIGCAVAWLGNTPSERERADRAARDEFAGRQADPRRYLTHLEREAFYEQLPEGLSTQPEVVVAAPARSVVRRFYKLDPSADEWLSLPIPVRMVWTHRELWGRMTPMEPHPLLADVHPVIVALRALYACNMNPQPAERRASSFDRAFRELLLEQVVSEPKAPLDLRPLVSDCMLALRDQWGRDLTPNIPHCEARHWAKGERNPRGENAWCPRCARGCTRASVSPKPLRHSYALEGARIDALRELTWELASLNEVLELLGATPPLVGLATNERYSTAIGGWANRLNEIRSRLVCRVCESQLVPNFAYARRPDARYNKTFFLCPDGHYPAPGRYFNHCWCCEHVIDSDESPHQARRIQDGNVIHGLHYCIHCGAGPNPSDNSQCDIGEICPKCGHRHRLQFQDSDGDFARLQCLQNDCRHVIRVPLRSIRNGLRFKVNYRPPLWWDQVRQGWG